MNKNLFAVAALTLLLSGCNTTNEAPPLASASAQPDLPPQYRQAIVDRVRKEWFDPYSVRDATISEPFYGKVNLGASNAAWVCVRANAKNRFGAYVGQRTTLFTFREGAITNTDQEYAAMACANAQFGPFAELETGGPTAAAAPARR